MPRVMSGSPIQTAKMLRFLNVWFSTTTICDTIDPPSIPSPRQESSASDPAAPAEEDQLRHDRQRHQSDADAERREATDARNQKAEVLPEEPGEERQREEQARNDSQGFHRDVE